MPFPVKPFAQNSCIKGSEQIELLLKNSQPKQCLCRPGLKVCLNNVHTQSATRRQTLLPVTGMTREQMPHWTWMKHTVFGNEWSWRRTAGYNSIPSENKGKAPTNFSLLSHMHMHNGNCPVGTLWVWMGCVTIRLQKSKPSLDLCSHKCGFGSFPLFLTSPWNI